MRQILSKKGARLAIVGAENWGNGFKQAGDLDRALAKVEEKILKFYFPTIFSLGSQSIASPL